MKVEFKKLEISNEIRQKIESLTFRKDIKITYYNGYITKFEKSNIESISLHKIILSNPLKNLLIMHYADYIQNDDLYFIDRESEPLTMSKLRDYIKDYF